MKRTLKLLLGILGIFVLVFVLSAVVISVYFDPNDYKDKISELVQQQTGRSLAIKGDISFSFFPWLGLSIGETEMGNAKGFGSQPFAAFDDVGVKVALLPLLRQEIVVDTIYIDGLRASLAVNKQGENNWQDLIPKEEKSEAETPQDSTQETSTALPKFELNGLRVQDARMVWDDQQAGAKWTVDKLKLNTGPMALNAPLDIQLAFDVDGGALLPKKHIEFDSVIDLNLEKDTLTIDKLKLALPGINLDGKIRGTGIQTQPNINGQLSTSDFAPRELMEAWGVEPPKTQDTTVLGKAKLETTFQFKDNNVQLPKLQLKLDDTTVSGSAGVDDLANLAIRFMLNIDNIDIDRYLPPSEPEAASPATQAPANAPEAELIPVALLQSLNVNGAITIGKLKATNLRSEQIEVNITAKKGDVRIHPAKAKLYQGTYSGDIRVLATKQVPTVLIDEKLTGVEAEPLLKDLMDLKLIGGRATVSAKLSTTGNTISQFRSGLNGNVSFAFLDGVIKGYNVMHEIDKANAVLAGKPKPPEQPKQTPFAKLTGSAKVVQGVVHNNDLLAVNPVIQANGKGTVDLVKEKINYGVQVKVIGESGGELGKLREKLQGHPLPFKISGALTSPTIKLDSKAIKDIYIAAEKAKVERKVEEKRKEVKQEIDQKVEEEKRQLEDKAKKKLEDKLKNLFR